MSHIDMSEDKDKIRRGVYYADDGFGSINDTYNQSHRILNTTTLNDVKLFKINRNQDKLNHIEVSTGTLQKTMARDTSRSGNT